jgi:hypothetical protein
MEFLVYSRLETAGGDAVGAMKKAMDEIAQSLLFDCAIGEELRQAATSLTS